MGRITLNTRNYIYERDNYRCLKCGKNETLTIDHIIPLIKKGGNSKDNLQTLCYQCNQEKGAEIIDYRVWIPIVQDINSDDLDLQVIKERQIGSKKLGITRPVTKSKKIKKQTEVKESNTKFFFRETPIVKMVKSDFSAWYKNQPQENFHI